MKRTVCLLVTLCAAAPALARPVQSWSTSELWQKSDVVVIATPEATADEKGFAPAHPKPETWVPVRTRLKVIASLKGKPGGARVSVSHLRYYGKEAEVTVIDGPAFVRFDPAKGLEYLVFLKRAEDGVLEPLSGQYDPGFSFKLLGEHVNPAQP